MAVRNKLYYPQSQIVTNLHTSGKEWMTESGEEYVGYYHKYIDGKVASGAVYVKGQSVTLIKYIDHAVQPDNALYNSLIKKKFTPISPKQTIPIPVADKFDTIGLLIAQKDCAAFPVGAIGFAILTATLKRVSLTQVPTVCVA